MTGQLDNGTDGKGVRYAARIRALISGGRVTVHGNILSVNGANEVTFFITAATDYRGFAGRQLTDPVAATLDDMNSATAHGYKSLRDTHIADYQKYFHRVSLAVGPYDKTGATKPTPERVIAFKNGADDLALPVLYFNFGRYLLISSSRPGGLPPNLAGYLGGRSPHTVERRLASGYQRSDELLAGRNLQFVRPDAAIVCVDRLAAGAG